MDFNLIIILFYILWGIIIGVTVGFTAIGIGLLGTPGLMIFFGMDPVTAVGTMGFAGAIMMFSSVVSHFKEKNVEWRIAGIFSLTALPASYFSAHYADAINNILPLRVIIGGVILVSVVLLFYRYVIINSKPRELSVDKWKLIISPFLGVFLGAFMGATSISGSLIVLVFLLILKLPSPVAVGTTTAVACISLAIAAVAHILENHIDWNAVIGLIPGVLIGGVIGTMFVKKVPRQILRYAILIILFAAGILILVKSI